MFSPVALGRHSFPTHEDIRAWVGEVALDRLSGHRGESKHCVPEAEGFVPDGFCFLLSLFNCFERVRNLRNYAWIISCLYSTVILELILKAMLLGATSLITSHSTVAEGSKRAEVQLLAQQLTFISSSQTRGGKFLKPPQF